MSDNIFPLSSAIGSIDALVGRYGIELDVYAWYLVKQALKTDKPVVVVGLPTIARLMHGQDVDCGQATLIPDSLFMNEANRIAHPTTLDQPPLPPPHPPTRRYLKVGDKWPPKYEISVDRTPERWHPAVTDPAVVGELIAPSVFTYYKIRTLE
jgi:hypothetical protein